jgi:hypothetical protein
MDDMILMSNNPMAQQKAPDARLANAEERVVAGGYVAVTKFSRNAADGLLAKPYQLNEWASVGNSPDFTSEI